MKKLKPNVKAGGKAKPIGSNLYYMSGRKHSQGGIDIGDTLEVEDGEIVQTDKNEVKVFSAQPILNGNSPAKLVMGGANPNKVFNAQEQFKDMNGLNDDGTKKAKYGTKKDNTNGEVKRREPGDSPYEDTRIDVSRKRLDLRKGAGKATGLNIGTKTMKVISKLAKTNRVLGPILEVASTAFPSKEAEYVEDVRRYGKNPTKGMNAKMKYGGNKERFPVHTGEYYGRSEGRAIKALRSVRNDSNYSYNGNTNFSPNTSTASMYDSLPVAANARTAIQQTNRRYSNPSTAVNNNTVASTAAKPNNKRPSFNDAFAAARKSGLDKFDWNGKSYGTQLAGANTSAKPTRPANELPEVTVTAPRVETLDRELPEINVNASRLPSMLNQNRYRSGFSLKKCGGKKAGGGLVTVNGNVVNKLVGNTSYPSSTGGRQKAAFGTRDKVDDVLDWAEEKEYKERIKKVKQRNADKTKRANRTKALREEGLQEVYSGGRVKKVPIKDPNESSIYRKAMEFNTAKRELPDVPKNNKKSNSPIENKGFTVRRGSQDKHYNSANEFKKDSDAQKKLVKDAAKRDAANPRTDFRDMLETPEFVPFSGKGADNTKKAASTSFGNNATNSDESANTPKPAATAPRRGSGTGRRSNKPTATSNNNKPAPKFAELNSMMQGLPAEFHRAKYTGADANTPDTLSATSKSGSSASASSNVPDVISSPKKRLALFDTLGANDIIGLGANLAGTIASGIHSRKQLDKMEAPKRPNPIIAQRMKTNFNINPQLGEIEENTNRMINDIGANTSSSRTRLQRVQRARNAAQYSKNNLRGQKENIETQLINQDRMNRQQVSAANTAQFNAWQDKTSQFNNSIREQRASSLNNMFSGINAGIQDMVGRIENRRNYKNTLGMYEATHPNVDKRLFKDKGVKF